MPRACTVCAHPMRDPIDVALVGGESYRDIAIRYALSKDAVYRHATNHLPETVQKAHAVQESARAGALLGRVERLISESEELLVYGKSEKQAKAWAAGISELRKCLELLARVTGELDDRHTQINLATIPEWIEVRSLILAAVGDFPDVRERVLNAIDVAA